MANVVEVVNLVKSDPKVNNNKYWRGTLMDDGMVHCEWGRIGAKNPQRKVQPGGKSFLDKKVKSKMRDGRNGEIGYRKIEIIDAPSSSTNTSRPVSAKGSDLKAIAKKQIKTKGDPETAKLLDYFTEQNIHDITNFTAKNITYNYDSGMFVTALGPVGQSTINEAREVLSEIADLVAVQDYGNQLMEHTRSLLMLIPQDIGRRRLELQSWWSGNKVSQQNSLLDGLEVSLQKASSTPTTQAEIEEEQVFDTTLTVVKNRKIIDPIFNYYHETKSPMHSCSRMNPIKLWKVKISSMEKAFKADGAKMANVVPGFHGSSTANCLSLLKTGMLIKPPKNASIAGALFGSGIYSAPLIRAGGNKLIKGSGSKALNYSTNFWGGKAANRTFMFVVEMAMGKFYTPKQRTYMSRSYPVQGYDSTWAFGNESGVRNDEAIVYRASQVNIKYLLEFK